MTTRVAAATASGLVCPACRTPFGATAWGETEAECPGCARTYPAVAGIPDLRLRSDRYLSLDAERAKAERLHALAPGNDLNGLARAYYELTDDVLDRRRDRFLRHIAGAQARGAALAGLLPARGRVLEVGCGSGGLLAAAGRPGREVWGVDIASRWLVVARRRLDDLGRRGWLVAAEAERLPWADATFDAVVADSLLEHLDDPALALREAFRVLRPGGLLVLWSPNRYSLATDPHLGLWGLGFLPRAALGPYLRHRGRTEWAPRTLGAAGARRLARDCGFARVVVGPPDLPRDPAWLPRRRERAALAAYRVALRCPPGRALLRGVGPLWQLTAERPASS